MGTFSIHNPDKVTAGKLAAAYLTCSALWIGISEVVPQILFPGQVLAGRITILLVSLYVVLTFAILYKLIRGYLQASRLAEEARTEIISHIAALEESRAVRQEALESFSIITGSIPSLIAHMDVEQRYLYVNSRYVEWVGRAEEEIVGRTAREILGEVIYNATVGCIEKVLQGNFACMERCAGPAGESRIQHMSFIPRFDEQGKVNSYFALINDITEIRQAEEQLRHAHKMEAIGTLAGGIAHDFNNLLTIIMGCAEMLNTGSDHNNKMATLIIEAANRGAGLTRSLLAFSRNQEIEVKAINPNTRIRNLGNFLCRIIGEDIVIKLVLCDGSPSVMADAEQFDQVVMNMVSNARDAMPQGGVLTIATYVSENNLSAGSQDNTHPASWVVVEISDTGSGMSRHTIGRIFDPFFTTKEVGKGTGLGLSMAYGIIKRHNGLIEVGSTPGKGTVFRILLPGVDLTAEAISTELTPALHPGSETILLVEDDPTLRQILGTMLVKCGYHVLVATNGEEGVTIYRNTEIPIHLILTDVIMPVKNGIEMCREIRSTNPEVPIIFMSGYDAGYVESFAAAALVVHYLPKPLKLPHLLAKIRQALDWSSPGTLVAGQSVLGPEEEKQMTSSDPQTV